MALFESLTARGMKQPLAQLISEVSPSAIPVPIADGGTGQTTKAAAFDALAPTTTRGDLIARGASSNGRLAVGSQFSFLGSDGTDPLWRSAANTRSDLGFAAPASVTVNWKGDSADPAIGDGTIVAKAALDGNFIWASVIITMGSTTTFGTGNWYVTLPSPYNANATAEATGSAYVFDAGTAYLLGTCFVHAGSNKIYIAGQSVINFFNATVPITWVATDTLTFSIRFPVT